MIRGLNIRREPAARPRRREPEARPVQRGRLLLRPRDVSHPKPVRSFPGKREILSQSTRFRTESQDLKQRKKRRRFVILCLCLKALTKPKNSLVLKAQNIQSKPLIPQRGDIFLNSHFGHCVDFACTKIYAKGSIFAKSIYFHSPRLCQGWPSRTASKRSSLSDFI